MKSLAASNKHNDLDLITLRECVQCMFAAGNEKSIDFDRVGVRLRRNFRDRVGERRVCVERNRFAVECDRHLVHGGERKLAV